MTKLKYLNYLLSFLLVATAARAAEPLSVAILDFETPTSRPASGGSDLLRQTTSPAKNASTGAEIAVLLNAYLSASPHLMLVERAELGKILSEQELGLSGTINAATAATVGYLTGAKVLVTGRAFQVGPKNFVVARIISTETSRVYGETVTYADAEAFDSACQELAGKISGVIGSKADTLIAKVADPEEQVQRLQKLVEGQTLPSVAIDIPESHFSRTIPDPAVETEMRNVLAKLGFQVIDQKESTATPDITIKGEAFSEFGARKNNLISTRARVEVRVLRAADKELLLSDRAVAVAVDLSENIAAKEALARAARKLLDRVVPVLKAK